MEDIQQSFVINGSTKVELQAFVEDIRNKWGEKLIEEYEVRVLPDVDDTKIYSFQVCDEKEGEEVDFVFQQNNIYFIAWGTPDNMIIFKDASKNFQAKEDVDSKNLSQGTSYGVGFRQSRRRGPPTLVERITHKTPSGVEYHLDDAHICGLDSSYGSLEGQGKTRKMVRIGREALKAALHECRKPFVPIGDVQHPNYAKRIAHSTIAFNHTFPESLRNNKILMDVLEKYEFGGLLPPILVKLENNWNSKSKQLYKLLFSPTKPEEHEGQEEREQKQELCEELGLIMRYKEENEGGMERYKEEDEGGMEKQRAGKPNKKKGKKGKGQRSKAGY